MTIWSRLSISIPTECNAEEYLFDGPGSREDSRRTRGRGYRHTLEKTDLMAFGERHTRETAIPEIDVKRLISEVRSERQHGR